MPVKEVNKSEEVRKLHKGGVKSASEIVKRLKARNITVAPSQVYQVLSTKKGKQANKAAASHTSAKTDVIDSAVVFVRQAGGMQRARELLSKLAMLHN